MHNYLTRLMNYIMNALTTLLNGHWRHDEGIWSLLNPLRIHIVVQKTVLVLDSRQFKLLSILLFSPFVMKYVCGIPRSTWTDADHLNNAVRQSTAYAYVVASLRRSLPHPRIFATFYACSFYLNMTVTLTSPDLILVILIPARVSSLLRSLYNAHHWNTSTCIWERMSRKQACTFLFRKLNGLLKSKESMLRINENKSKIFSDLQNNQITLPFNFLVLCAKSNHLLRLA